MSDKEYGLRTVSRIGVYRQVLITNGTNPPIPGLLPIAIPSAPTSIKINPNEDELELPDVNCKGEEVIGLVVTKGFKPEIQLEFPEGVPDMDSFVHGRLMQAQTNIAGFVFFEAQGSTGQVTIPGRVVGDVGYEVAAQSARTNSQIYYIDSQTKLAKEVAIVAVGATPAADQVIIDQHLAITLSPELAASGVILRGWVPCTFAKATVISSQPLGMLTVYGMGVDFGGRVANLTVRNCARRPGGELGSDPKRQVNLRILPDPNDGNGLGYQMRYLNQKVAC